MESKNPFDQAQALEVIQNEFTFHFDEKTTYNPQEAMKVCAAMSIRIRNAISEMDFDRYIVFFSIFVLN